MEERILDEAYRIYKLRWLIINGGEEYEGISKSEFALTVYKDPSEILKIFSMTNTLRVPSPYSSWVRAWIEANSITEERLKAVYVEDLGLTPLITQRLKNVGFKTAEDICSVNVIELKARIGNSNAKKVVKALKECGMEIKAIEKKDKK